MSESATFLQIDLQSLFNASYKKIDFEKVWNHFNGRETEFLTKATIYNIENPVLDYNKFDIKLKAIGYELKTRLLTNKNRGLNISSTVTMTLDCISMLQRYDKLILMTNNSSFIDLCTYVRSLGKTVELWSFDSNYDPAVKLYVDKMQFIEDNLCFQKPSISVFGINFGLEKILDSTAY